MPSSRVASTAGQSDEILKSVLDAANDLVWCTSLDGHSLLYMSPAAERIYGRPPADFFEHRNLWFETIHPDDQPCVKANLKQLLMRGQIEHVYRIMRPDGEVRRLHDRVSVIYDEAGTPVRVGGIATDVTDRLQAEEALHESETVYNTLVESLPLAIFRKDRAGRRVFANQRYCEFLGVSLQDVIGKRDEELFPPELAGKFTRDDQEVLNSGTVLRHAEPHRRADGKMRFIEVVKSPIRDAAGRITGVQGIIWDVTDRRETEAALRESQSYYQSLVESLPLAVFRKDRQFRLVFGNQRFCDAIGRTLDAYRGQTDFELFPRELAEKYRRDDQRVLETGQPFEDIEEWNDANGVRRYIQVFKAPVKNAEGEIVGVQGMFWDVTSRKWAEESLKQTNALLDSVIDNIPIMLFMKDAAKLRFVRFNKAGEELVGIRREEMIGKNDFDFYPREEAEFFTQKDREVLGNKQLVDVAEETIHTRRHGSRILHTKKIPILDEQGKPQFLLGISEDITEKKQAEAELRQATEAAQAANRAKSDFLANMSHEIRTPMNAIIGMTELLLDTRLTPAQRDYLKMVQESGESLLTLINDILDFSKIEAGKLDLESAAFRLRDSLGDTMKSLALRAHGKGLELAFHVHSDVPDALLGDVGRLRQIVVNLVGNAIKFTDRGEVFLDVSRESHEGDAIVLHFSVTDTGIGIPADKCDSIFQEFIQADTSTTRSYGGTGLGLAISSRLVDLMNGQIWVESEVGRGSTFHFRAKFGIAADELLEPRREMSLDFDESRVLIVDDNATNRRILIDLMNNWGMHPTDVPGARAALDELRRAYAEGEPFRLVLTDVNMPEVDGYKLTEWIREDAKLADTIVIMLTSGGRPGDGNLRTNLGVAAHLLKPVKQSELFDAIAMAFGITAPASAAADRSAPCAKSQRRLDILLAEDNKVNQKLAIGMLSKQGHRVTVASDGREAVDAVQRQEFDLVLMDVQMPEMDGFAATKAIRAREQETGRRVPIIAMTAHAMTGDRERCLAAGMDEYVSKPIRTQQLFEKFALVIGDADESTGAEPKSAPIALTIDWDEALAGVGGDSQLLREVVEVFLDEAPRLLAELRRAAAEKDTDSLRRAAHSLKGAMLYLGASQTSERAQDLELMGMSGNLEDADDALTALDEQLRLLIQQLNLYLSKDSSPA